MRSIKQATGVGIAALLCTAAPSVAAEPVQPVEPAVVHVSPFGAAAPVDKVDLAAITGRAETSMTIRAQNSATVSNNSVTGQSQTGTIRFDGDSFTNLNGLSLLSANTGNNVAINSSLNVNVAIQR